jgi:hypothetical protein
MGGAHMTRAPLTYWTVYLQTAVALIFMLGYFAMMAILFLGFATIPDNLLELAKTLAIALTNAMGLLFAFLYLRSRQEVPVDPSTTTVTQTTQSVTTPTLPTGATHAPLPPAGPPAAPERLSDPGPGSPPGSA